MARLASQIKLGYYPTPPEVVEQVKKLFHFEPGARLLDPCCGEGKALHAVAEGADVLTYGVELDKERFKEAKDFVDNVLWADALHEVTLSRKGFSFLWLNPPYDTDSDLGGKRDRVEIQFLKKYWDFLQPGGVLVYVVPDRSAALAAPFLSTRCRNLVVFRFPEPYCRDYDQVIAVCTKARPGKEEISTNAETLEQAQMLPYSYGPQDRFPLMTDLEAGLKYQVPAAQIEQHELVFRSHRLNPDEALQRVKKSPIWVRVISTLFSTGKHNEIKPLMPLREGHLAMLLASGMMNGEVIGEDDQRLVVKGSVRKVLDTRIEETEKETKHISTDRYEITVRAICFDPLEIVTIK